MTRNDVQKIINETINPSLGSSGGVITFLEATTYDGHPTIILELTGVEGITHEAVDAVRSAVQLILQQKLSLPTLKVKMIGERC